MTFRTPNLASNAGNLLDYQRVKERMAMLDQQISTGKRIVSLSDDPTGSALIMDFRNSIARNEQYSRQVNSAASSLQAAETSLTGISDHLIRLMEMGVQAQGTTTTDVMRAALVPEAQGLLTSMLSLANQQDQGKYIFAGAITTGTPPFAGASVNPTVYSGDSFAIDLDVSMGTTITTNLPGNAVFIGSAAPSTDLFQQVSLFIAALAPPSNMGQIQTAAANIGTIFSGVQQQIAELGGRQAALLQIKTTLENFNLSLNSMQKTTESVDYPQAYTDYQQESIVQQASLSMMSRANAQQNLFNFLS